METKEITAMFATMLVNGRAHHTQDVCEGGPEDADNERGGGKGQPRAPPPGGARCCTPGGHGHLHAGVGQSYATEQNQRFINEAVLSYAV